MDPNYYFSYTVDPSADEPIMLIDRHIGMDETDGIGILGDLFQRELLVLDGMGKKRIQVWINSPGGMVSDGWNIANAILKSETKVDTYCTGIAASIAGVIFQMGRKRIMNDYGILMYHNPFGGDDKSLEATKNSLITMMCSRSGMDQEAMEKLMKRTTFLSAQEAKDMNLCDEIHESTDFNKKRAIPADTQGAKAYWSDANKVLNKIFNIKNSSVMTTSKIANRLKLNPEANEEAVISAIDGIENKISEKDTEIGKLKIEAKNSLDALAKKETEYNLMVEEVTKHKNELDAMKAANKLKDDAAAAKDATDKAEKAKNLITGLVTAGKIKNEQKIIDSWTTKAIENYDDVNGLFDGLPLNKIANKLEAVMDDKTKVKLTSVVANKMAALRNEMNGIPVKA